MRILYLVLLLGPFPPQGWAAFQKTNSEKSLGGFTTISDNRIELLGKLQTIGNGYSLLANQKYNSCLKKKSAKKSIDLSLSITKYSPDQYETPAKSWVQSRELQFIDQHTKDKKRKFIILKIEKHQLSQNDNIYDSELLPYYSKILQKGDWTSFFSSCGTHVINSKIDYASLWGVISYKPQAKDNFFKLVKSIIESYYNFEEIDKKELEKIKKQVLEFRPEVTTLYFGHPKIKITPQKENLFSLKKTIQNSYKLLSKTQTGTTEQIEVLSYGSIHSFLENIQAYEDALVEEERHFFLQNYIHRQSFYLNSEYISKLTNNLSQIRKTYFRLVQCHDKLVRDYPLSLNNKWKLFRNNRKPNNKNLAIPLLKMHLYFSMRMIQYYSKQANVYESKVLMCLSKLDGVGVSKTRYSQIKECLIERSAPYRLEGYIKDYCPPKEFL